jgi:hypothetical protein
MDVVAYRGKDSSVEMSGCAGHTDMQKGLVPLASQTEESAKRTALCLRGVRGDPWVVLDRSRDDPIRCVDSHP